MVQRPTRPGWFTRRPEGAARITQKGEPFHGHDVALDSLSALIARIVTTPASKSAQASA